jgi:hypothetical protein
VLRRLRWARNDGSASEWNASADGFAVWVLLDNGEIELRFSTGETFILAEKVIVRLAS